MNDVATLLRAIATLLWPILVFVALWVFREPLAQALSRLKKGKILGQEFELERDLQKLEETTAAARQETSLVPRLELKEDALQDDNQEPDTEIRSILEQAARSPKVALMFLSAELEKQGRLALAMRGMLQHRTTVPVSRALEELRQYGFLRIYSARFSYSRVSGTRLFTVDRLKMMTCFVLLIQASQSYES